MAEALQVEVGSAGELLRLYPNPTSASLRRAVAEHHGLRAENVCVGNGSDDILNLLVYGYEHANAPQGVKPSNESVLKVLNGVKGFDGMMGKLSIDSRGVVFSPASIKIIKDGKPTDVASQ